MLPSSGTAALCPEFRFIHDGVEFADKLLLQSAQMDVHQFRLQRFLRPPPEAPDPNASVLPEYLRNQATESGAVIDIATGTSNSGAVFVRFKLWFVIRHYGIKGLQHHIREHVRLARNSRPGAQRFALRTCRAGPAQPRLFPLVRGRIVLTREHANQLLMERL